jgi:hypothetical protein
VVRFAEQHTRGGLCSSWHAVSCKQKTWRTHLISFVTLQTVRGTRISLNFSRSPFRSHRSVIDMLLGRRSMESTLASSLDEFDVSNTRSESPRKNLSGNALMASDSSVNSSTR